MDMGAFFFPLLNIIKAPGPTLLVHWPGTHERLGSGPRFSQKHTFLDEYTLASGLVRIFRETKTRKKPCTRFVRTFENLLVHPLLHAISLVHLGFCCLLLIPFVCSHNEEQACTNGLCQGSVGFPVLYECSSGAHGWARCASPGQHCDDTLSGRP